MERMTLAQMVATIEDGVAVGKATSKEGDGFVLSFTTASGNFCGIIFSRAIGSWPDAGLTRAMAVGMAKGIMHVGESCCMQVIIYPDDVLLTMANSGDNRLIIGPMDAHLPEAVGQDRVMDERPAVHVPGPRSIN